MQAIIYAYSYNQECKIRSFLVAFTFSQPLTAVPLLLMPKEKTKQKMLNTWRSISGELAQKEKTFQVEAFVRSSRLTSAYS